MGAKIAIAGAGIYGATVAIRLAEHGHQVTLFDPLRVMRAASAQSLLVRDSEVRLALDALKAGAHAPRSTLAYSPAP